MKTAKPSATTSDTAPNRRQPVRQTRTNPPRSTAASSRAVGRDRDGTSGAAQEQPIDIFPAVTHFADAITALPKELVKHFTLLKEVDAKIHVPQQALFQLIDTALRQPAPNTTRSPYDGTTAISAPALASMAAHNSHGGPSASTKGHHVSLTSQTQLQAAVYPPPASSAFDQSNLPRRQLFRKVAIEIKEMLVALEEKNHVISTANEALNKQLGRIDDVWPHLELEFSEDAKWGSNTHWAYPENRAASRATNNAQAEKSRREGAASLSAAAQQIAEEAAARSDARKQAVAARRSQKAQQQANHQDSDADDHLQKAEPRKSGAGSKSRRPLADPTTTTAGVGLGISGAAGAGAASSGATSAPKRRKVEKPAGASTPMERALSGVYGVGASNGSKAKTSSPRESPAPDGGTKKRKALPSSGNTTKKSRNGASATSSPVIGAFSDASKTARASPAPTSISGLAAHASESLSRNTSQSGAVNGSATSVISPPAFAAEMATTKTANTAASNGTTNVTNFVPDDRITPVSIPRAEATTTAPISSITNSNVPLVSTKTNEPTKESNNASSASSSSSGINVAPTTSATTPVVEAIPESNEIKDAAVAPAATSSAIAQAPQPRVVSEPVEDDQSAAQLKDENSKPQPPLLLATESKQQKNEPILAPTAAVAAPRTNGSRTASDKPNKESPVPVPANIPPPVAAPPAKVEGLKMEAVESSPPAVAMAMTRTRSAGGSSSNNNNNNGNSGITTSHHLEAKRDHAAGTKASSTASTKSSDEISRTKKEATPSSSILAIQPPPVTTKSGRASKPSTPGLATFAEAASSRARPSRSSEPASLNGNSGSGSGGSTSGATKRSHKKGASSISSQAHGHSLGHHRNSSTTAADEKHNNSSISNSNNGGGHGLSSSGSSRGNGSGGDGGSSSSRSHHSSQQQHKPQQQQQQHMQQNPEEDEDDPLYCYCNRVSFGEMIACDADDCKREWFHLECAGLRVAPKTNVKWYCDDCKKRLKVGDRKTNGR